MRKVDRENPPETTFDVAYLLAEIGELKRIAEGRGYGTLAYLLECAAIEAKWQARIQQEESTSGLRPECGSEIGNRVNRRLS